MSTYLQQGNSLPHFKSLVLKKLIKAYISRHGKKPHGKCLTSTETVLATAIYIKCPRTYKRLQHIMALPNVRTIQSLLQNAELEPGISETTMNRLKYLAIRLKKRNKMCTLLFGVMPLKKSLTYNHRSDKVEGFVDMGDVHSKRSSEIANHALVFMIQGLHVKIKQPIAYYFVKWPISCESLAMLIKSVIKVVNEAGYTVITTVCDQGPTNVGSLNLLKEWCGIPMKSNYFLIDEAKIWIMFDIPHLFLTIRNNFHAGGEIILDGKKGNWSYLLDLGERNRTYLHLHKLIPLEGLLNPMYSSKMKVRLAAQHLSNRVAAFLKLNARTYEDDIKRQEALETGHIVEDLDQLFDCTNGPAIGTFKEEIIRGRRQIVSLKTNHVDLWRYFRKKMSTMHFTKNDSFLKLKNERCVKGYITSLLSLEDIWKQVQSKGFKHLNLRRLNKDSLENLFWMIRQLCPTNCNPTCHHFIRSLKSNILATLRLQFSRGANREKDDNEAIFNFHHFIQHVVPHVEPENKVLTSLENQSENMVNSKNYAEVPVESMLDDDDEEVQMEMRLFECFEKQPTVYVAGYLASIVLNEIPWQCENCNASLKILDPKIFSDQKMYDYTKLCEWWIYKKSLTYPTIHLCQLVDTAIACFEAQIRPILHEKQISQQFVVMMLTKCDNLLWICNNHKDQLLLTLLVRVSHLLIRNECHRYNL